MPPQEVLQFGSFFVILVKFRQRHTQISGFRKGVRSSDKFSVFSLSYFPIFAIFLLFANWMTTIVTELNAKVNPEKAEYI